jgi:di/tricarboxylate transporter
VSTSYRVRWGIVLTAVLVAALLNLAPPAGVGARPLHAGSLCLVAIALIATGVLPEHITALGFFVVAVLFSVAPAGVVFGGFLTSALWLVFGGLFIAAGVQKTGLGARIARSLIQFSGGSYARILAGTIAASFVLMIVMPSVMGRVLILVPLAAILADELGYDTGAKGRAGIIAAVIMASFATSGAILPSNVVNMILVGGGQQVFGIHFTYGGWLLLHFPINGLLKAVLIYLVCWRLFNQPPRAAVKAEARRAWSAAELRMALILGGALVVWATDSLHGLDPGWVGLAAGILTLLPGVGVLEGGAFDRDIAFGPVFYTAGLMGIGKVISWSGVGDLLGHGLLAVAPFTAGAHALNYALIFVFTNLLGLFTGQLGATTIITPLAGKIAAASQMPVYAVLMTYVAAYSNIWFPYQTTPTLIGVRMAGLSLFTGAKVMAISAALYLLILAPINFLWWEALGLFG